MNTENTKEQVNNNCEYKNEFDMPQGGNFVRDGKVYILGGFDSSISQCVIPDLVNLIEKKKLLKNPNIDIYINSRGGIASELLGLLSLMSIARKDGIMFTTYNIGMANSCGSILFIHGDLRKMYSCATNIMHLGYASSCYTTFEQLDRSTKRTKAWFNTIVKWYMENTKMKKSEIIKILKDDQYCMDAEECLEKGLCDEII